MQTPNPPRFIVAELSKNWIEGRAESPTPDQPVLGMLLSQHFERFINYNAARGYRLFDWKLHRCMTGYETMNETIIAIFEHTGAPEAP